MAQKEQSNKTDISRKKIAIKILYKSAGCFFSQKSAILVEY